MPLPDSGTCYCSLGPSGGALPKSGAERSEHLPQDLALGHQSPATAGGGRGGLKAGGERERTLRCHCLSVSRAVGPPANPGMKLAGTGGTSQGSRCSWYSTSLPHAPPQRPPPANRTVRGLVGLRVLRLRRSAATACVRTTIPKKRCAPAWLLGVVVQSGEKAREAGGSGNYMSQFAVRRARGAKGLNRGSPSRGKAALAVAGAGGADGRGLASGPGG